MLAPLFTICGWCSVICIWKAFWLNVAFGPPRGSSAPDGSSKLRVAPSVGIEAEWNFTSDCWGLLLTDGFVAFCHPTVRLRHMWTMIITGCRASHAQKKLLCNRATSVFKQVKSIRPARQWWALAELRWAVLTFNSLSTNVPTCTFQEWSISNRYLWRGYRSAQFPRMSVETFRMLMGHSATSCREAGHGWHYNFKVPQTFYNGNMRETF